MVNKLKAMRWDDDDDDNIAVVLMGWHLIESVAVITKLKEG